MDRAKAIAPLKPENQMTTCILKGILLVRPILAKKLYEKVEKRERMKKKDERINLKGNVLRSRPRKQKMSVKKTNTPDQEE